MTTTVLQTFQFFWCPQYEDRIRLSCATAMPTLWRRKDGQAERETEDNTWLLSHMLSLCLVLSQIASPRFSSSFWVTFTIFHDYLCPHVQTLSLSFTYKVYESLGLNQTSDPSVESREKVELRMFEKANTGKSDRWWLLSLYTVCLLCIYTIHYPWSNIKLIVSLYLKGVPVDWTFRLSWGSCIGFIWWLHCLWCIS